MKSKFNSGKVYGVVLRERVCAEKLAVLPDQQFTTAELADPILSGIDANDPIARNPCLRRGPLSPDYWTRLPAQWAKSLGWTKQAAKAAP